jgi:D-glycero-D-manno-heptose 1,7-bisphosphate phosphatase
VRWESIDSDSSAPKQPEPEGQYCDEGLIRITILEESSMSNSPENCTCSTTKRRRAEPIEKAQDAKLGAKRTVKRVKRRRKKKVLRPCVYLDRDGVVNEGGLINKPSDFHLIPGVVDAIIALKQAGFLVGITSNQSGIAEDYEGKVLWRSAPLNRAKLRAIHDEMIRLLGPAARPYFIKVCPHSKSLNCRCRKPKPGMLNAAARKYKIDKKRSFMVGDSATDVEAGINAGVTPIFVLSGHDPKQIELCPPNTLVFPSLREAAPYMISIAKSYAAANLAEVR